MNLEEIDLTSFQAIQLYLGLLLTNDEKCVDVLVLPYLGDQQEVICAFDPHIQLVAEVIIIRTTCWWDPGDKSAPGIVGLYHRSSQLRGGTQSSMWQKWRSTIGLPLCHSLRRCFPEVLGNTEEQPRHWTRSDLEAISAQQL